MTDKVNRPLVDNLRDLLLGIVAAFKNRRVRGLLLFALSLVAIASVFYSWAEGWGPLDAIYFSVITISTVGYGDFSPQTPMGKLFTIFYVLIGLGIFVAAVSAIADVILSRRADHSRLRPGDDDKDRR